MTLPTNGWDLSDWLERLTANAKVATVLGSIPASSDTVESEGRQMKQCWKLSILLHQERHNKGVRFISFIQFKDRMIIILDLIEMEWGFKLCTYNHNLLSRKELPGARRQVWEFASGFTLLTTAKPSEQFPIFACAKSGKNNVRWFLANKTFHRTDRTGRIPQLLHNFREIVGYF